MFKKLPELLINGVSLYLLGKELVDNTKAQEQLQNLKLENKEAREEVRALHLQFLEIMAQIREVETDRTDMYRLFLKLVEQVEELGFHVDENGQLYEPEEVNAESLAQILDGDDDLE